MTEPYSSLTIHFINSDWNLYSRCLWTSFAISEHIGERIANRLKEALSAWGLDEGHMDDLLNAVDEPFAGCFDIMEDVVLPQSPVS